MLKATQQPHMHCDDTLQAKNNIFVLNFRYVKNFFWKRATLSNFTKLIKVNFKSMNSV
jgi:hypothetical protein